MTDAETLTLTFDFISKLALGETISSAVASYAVYSGASSATLTLGSPAISSSRVTCTAAGGTEGVVYLVMITATTSTGQIILMSGFLAVVPEGA